MDPDAQDRPHLFARFSREKQPLPPLREAGMRIRIASEEDIPGAASLAARRDGGAARDHEPSMRSFAEGGHRRLHVAEYDGRIVGFGKCHRRGGSGPVAGNIPPGWYLAGLAVDPGYRRRGVGLDLTRVRLEWLFERVPSVYYFASALNAASIALHEAVGFREIARGITVPGVTFTGGLGVLYALERGAALDFEAARRLL